MGEVIQFLIVASVIFAGGIWLRNKTRHDAADRSRLRPPEAPGATPSRPTVPPTAAPTGPATSAPTGPGTFGRKQPSRSAEAAGITYNADSIAAEYRQQAKESDDRHKAELRGHVERPLPPITDEGRQAIERARQAWIAIKHVFPPRVPQRSMSYLGGAPIVPDSFEWPTVHNRKGLLERLNFMAQIDCSELPDGPARNLLPKSGYLYFFAPFSDSFGPDANHFVCRYEAGPVTKKWTPLDIGFVSELQHDDPVEGAWRGKRTFLDKFEIEYGWIEEPSEEEVANRSKEGHAFEVAKIIEQEKSDAFFGPPGPPDQMFRSDRAPRDQVWIPYEGFPINWRSVRILERLVRAYYQEETADLEKRMKELGDVPEHHPEVERLKSLKDELNRFSMTVTTAFFHDARVKDHEPVPKEMKKRVLDYLEKLRVNGMPSSKERPYSHLRLPAIINDWVKVAAIHGAEAGLMDEENAALISPEVVAALAHRHGARGHHMLGEGTPVQVAAEDNKDRYILLLQIGPDPALNWTVGEMGPLQYWITPEDLAARNFEHTVLTIEAY